MRTDSLAIFAFIHLAALVAAGHAICYKRDSRSAVSWVAVILFVPLAGTLAYFWFGINRVRLRARGLRGKLLEESFSAGPGPSGEPADAHPALVLSGRLNRGRLSGGNELELLVDPESAYPRMLKAIEGARNSISLATYIFDNDPVGRRFADALCRAGERGVQVRVLVDAVGARYSFPSIFGRLRAPNLSAVRFLDTLLPWRFHYSQLRNHRKILVVDGEKAFTGGMNLREGNGRDLHFAVKGGVVGDLQRAFAADWEFAAREKLEGERWFPRHAALEAPGEVWARVVSDGPDEGRERLRWTFLAALNSARRSARILTPYFVPDSALISALGMAALRGVQVEILLPGRNNVFLVEWASRALLWQVLERGCRVFFSPPPFDHSKLFIVDDEWAMVGSANWDARSLRLNFELGIELQGREFVGSLAGEFARKRQASREISLAEVDARSFPVRLRDGTARLFSPYL